MQLKKNDKSHKYMAAVTLGTEAKNYATRTTVIACGTRGLSPVRSRGFPPIFRLITGELAGLPTFQVRSLESQ